MVGALVGPLVKMIRWGVGDMAPVQFVMRERLAGVWVTCRMLPINDETAFLITVRPGLSPVRCSV